MMTTTGPSLVQLSYPEGNRDELIPAPHVKSSPKEHENDYREATSDRGECNAIECVSN